MKKLIILVSAVALSTTMFAQKGTADNPYSLEGTVNFTGSEGITWAAPSVRARYFFKDNLAARIDLGYSSKSMEDVGDSSSSSIGLGIEYHLAGNDKMSPYFYGGLALGSTSMKSEGEDASKTSNLGFGVKAGLDYYISENLYVGVEIDLVNFKTSSSGDGEDKTTTTDLNFAGGSAIRLGWRF